MFVVIIKSRFFSEQRRNEKFSKLPNFFETLSNCSWLAFLYLNFFYVRLKLDTMVLSEADKEIIKATALCTAVLHMTYFITSVRGALANISVGKGRPAEDLQGKTILTGKAADAAVTKQFFFCV